MLKSHNLNIEFLKLVNSREVTTWYFERKVDWSRIRKQDFLIKYHIFKINNIKIRFIYFGIGEKKLRIVN